MVTKFKTLFLFACFSVGTSAFATDCIYQKKSVVDPAEPSGKRHYIVVADANYTDCLISCHPREQGLFECYQVHSPREELCRGEENPIYRQGTLECDSAACGLKTSDGKAFECVQSRVRLGD